jgi:hypothetical protein
MFLWAALQFQRINTDKMDSEEDIVGTLSEPIKNFSTIYDKIYQQITHLRPESQTVAQKL